MDDASSAEDSMFVIDTAKSLLRLDLPSKSPVMALLLKSEGASTFALCLKRDGAAEGLPAFWRARRNARTTVTGIFDRVVTTVHQSLCGLHGHDALLHFDQGRISLLCTSWGHETPGWEVKQGAAQTRVAPKANLVRLPLVQHRKVA
jgi:hypothetical protein